MSEDNQLCYDKIRSERTVHIPLHTALSVCKTWPSQSPWMIDSLRLETFFATLGFIKHDYLLGMFNERFWEGGGNQDLLLTFKIFMVLYGG